MNVYWDRGKFFEKTPEDEKSRDTVPLNMRHTTYVAYSSGDILCIYTYIHICICSCYCLYALPACCGGGAIRRLTICGKIDT
jgi:hypothetical protein